MNSAIVKVLAVVLAWPLAALTIIQVYEWYKEATYVRVVEPVNRDRIQYPVYQQFAQDALRNYAALEKREQQYLKDELRRVLKPVDPWIDTLNQSDTDIICLGEAHNEHTRQFLANNFLSGLAMDMLAVETTPGGLQEINKYMKDGEIYVPMLGADMGQVLKAAHARNPAVVIQPIEETMQQYAGRRAQKTGSREGSIFTNFKRGYVPGKRSVILIGALHCNYKPNVLYQLLRQDLPETKLHNILVQGAHQDGLIETFVYFLDELEIAPGNFVITNTQDLPHWIQENFVWFWALTLTHYQSIVVYKP